MGNTPASVEITQANCPLVRLVEDVFVIVLRNIQLRDFISLMSTCKLFYYHRLGPNNYFWAQFCSPVAGGINKLLLAVQQGRRFVADGNPINLNMPILPTDKTMISHFNFRAELEKYFIFVVNRIYLESLFALKPPFAFLRRPVVTINSVATKWPNAWGQVVKSRQQYALDYYYYVDFGGNPAIVASNLIHSVLRDQIGGREVVYNNSLSPPPIYNTHQVSRMGPVIQSRTMLPQLAHHLPLPVQPPVAGFPSANNFNPKPWNGRFHPYDGKKNNKKFK